MADEAHRRKVNVKTDSVPFFGHRFNALFAYKYVYKKRVLDLGCWTGQMAKLLAPISRKYTGVDPSSEAINQARKNVTTAEFNVGRAEKLPFSEGSFDCVLLLDVIEHITPRTEVQVLKKINKILSSKGTLVITTPSSHPLSILLDPAYFLIAHRHYSLNELTKMLTKSGFVVIHSIHTGNIVNLISHNIDLIAKHIFKSNLALPKWMQNKIIEGYEKQGFAEIHLIAQKKSL